MHPLCSTPLSSRVLVRIAVKNNIADVPLLMAIIAWGMGGVTQLHAAGRCQYVTVAEALALLSLGRATIRPRSSIQGGAKQLALCSHVSRWLLLM